MFTHSPSIVLLTLTSFPGLWSPDPQIRIYQIKLILKQIPTDFMQAQQALQIIKLAVQMKPTYMKEIETWTLAEYDKSLSSATT